jgi:ATP adenylyltransferase
MMALMQRAQGILTEVMRPQGFNMGINQGSASGAGIAEHLHMHLVPRWVGDTNFMPVLGDTRVMPQHLDETYQLLKPRFDKE